VNQVLHIIGRDTPRSLLDQLSLLAGADDVILSVGPPPPGWEAPRPVTAVHEPLGRPALCGRFMAGRAKAASILHVWSHQAVLAAQAMAKARSCAVVWSLACPVPRQSPRDVPGMIRSVGLLLTVPTDACRRSFLEAGVPQDSLHVLPPATGDFDQRQQRRASVRALLGLDDRQRLLLAPSEVTYDGGHRLACWVLAVLRETRHDLRLLIPEGGPVLESVANFARSTGRGSEIFFTEGRLALADCLAAADVALFLHRKHGDVYRLSAGLAAGLPLAAAATPEVSEMTAGLAAVILTTPGDPRSASAAVLKLLEDPASPDLLSCQARRVTEQSAPSAVRRRLEDIYRACLAGASA